MYLPATWNASVRIIKKTVTLKVTVFYYIMNTLVVQ